MFNLAVLLSFIFLFSASTNTAIAKKVKVDQNTAPEIIEDEMIALKDAILLYDPNSNAVLLPTPAVDLSVFSIDCSNHNTVVDNKGGKHKDKRDKKVKKGGKQKDKRDKKVISKSGFNVFWVQDSSIKRFEPRSKCDSAYSDLETERPRDYSEFPVTVSHIVVEALPGSDAVAIDEVCL